MESTGSPASNGMKVTRRTRLVFGPGTSAVSIAGTVEDLRLPLTQKDEFALVYALEEAVFNALRATAQAEREEPVVADIEEDAGIVRVCVRDGAGGFDLNALPYDFDADPEEVDIASEKFDEYRENNDEERFGLGLLTLRGMVNDFRLTFIDHHGNEAPWRGKGSVFGTRVSFSLRCSPTGQERRRDPRYAVSGRAALADGPPAHIADLSLSGGRLIFSSRPAPRLDEVYPIRLVTEADPPVEINVWARVARAERIGNCYDIGVEFVDMTEEMKAGLGSIIQKVRHGARPEGVQVEVDLSEG